MAEQNSARNFQSTKQPLNNIPRRASAAQGAGSSASASAAALGARGTPEKPGPRRAMANERYKPTATHPHRRERQLIMHRVFKAGGRLALMEAMYEFARLDLNHTSAGEKTVKHSMELLLNDRGRKEMLVLLATISDALILACIDNTLGYGYMNMSEFSRILVHDQPGAYAMTVVRRGEPKGCFLNNEELKRVTDLMQYYIDSVGNKNDRKAMAIDTALSNLFSVEDTTRMAQGKRMLISADSKSQVFCDGLRSRMTVDPLNQSYHKQAPIMVGITHNIQSRISQHSTLHKLNHSSLPYVLLLSILRAEKIEFRVIGIPIIMAFEDSHRKSAEVLITMLCGSLVEDGGMNPVQAGTSTIREHQYGQAEVEIFIKNNTLSRNMELIAREVNNRKEILDSIDPIVGSEDAQKLEGGQELLADIEQKMIDEAPEILKTMAALAEENDIHRRQLESLQREREIWADATKFQARMLQLVEAQKGSDDKQMVREDGHVTPRGVPENRKEQVSTGEGGEASGSRGPQVKVDSKLEKAIKNQPEAAKPANKPAKGKIWRRMLPQHEDGQSKVKED